MQDDPIGPNPGGLCMCGCGGLAPLAPSTLKNGNVKGQPQRYIHGHNGPRRIPGALYRLEHRGHDTPCWIWNLTTNYAGYGIQSRWKGYSRLAYKALWVREHGPVPDGHQLDHLCRQTDCVRSSHLEVVTPAVNSRRSSRTKLTEAQVIEIRRLSAGGARRIDLAAVYGVDARSISNVCHRVTWKDVA